MSSESFDNIRFFKKGHIELHFPALRKNDSRLSKKQAAELTRVANSRESLENNFIKIVPLYRRIFSDGKNIVQTMLPTSPYAYGGVMVTAIGESLLSNEGNERSDDIIETKMIFNLDQEVKREYYKQILACIQIEEDINLPQRDAGSNVVAYENNMASISNEKYRLPRTISLPHAHIIKGGDWFDEEKLPQHPYGFKLERQFLQNYDLFTRFKNSWFDLLQQGASGESLKIPQLQIRNESPYGYTIDCNMDRSQSIDEQAQYLSQILTSHHEAYSIFSQEEINQSDEIRQLRRQEFAKEKGISLHKGRPLKEKLILQPSYRIYIYYDQSKLKISISPIFFACVGALEAMDVAVDRSIDHEQHFTDSDLQMFFEKFTVRLKETLEQSSQYEG